MHTEQYWNRKGLAIYSHWMTFWNLSNLKNNKKKCSLYYTTSGDAIKEDEI